MLTCEALQTVRDPEESATARLCVSLWDTYMLEEKLKLLLDNSVLDGLSDSVREEIYDISRGMCFALHSRRSVFIS